MKNYLDEAAQAPVERDPFPELRVQTATQAPDFELLPGRWAFCTPGDILAPKDYTRLKKAAKNAKRGEHLLYDEKLDAIVFAKVHGKETCVDTILESQPFKSWCVKDDLLALVPNDIVGSARNNNVLRFTLKKPANGYVVKTARGHVCIEIWRPDDFDGRPAVMLTT